ncbi:hypothetical protein [Hymenobacter sp.]|uniref:hypothetical protein n=1 Tax=Hymenobacter sp. TaxID=1898978 RepID=UPI00286D2C7C|nr:hypothetical protein [Hymenobacter sp.]
MPVSVVTTPSFLLAAKKLLKKYPSLKADLASLELQLLAKPDSGTPLGQNAYKIRLAIRSKGRGKSGGARIITHLETVFVTDEATQLVSLLYIYDKADTANISQRELEDLIKNL